MGTAAHTSKQHEHTPFTGQQRQAILQPRLEIGESNDKYEQEADAVADQVMMMPNETPEVQLMPKKTSTLRLKQEEGEDELMQMKPNLQLKNAVEEESTKGKLQTSSLIQRNAVEEETTEGKLQTKAIPSIQAKNVVEEESDEKKLQAKCDDCEEKVQRHVEKGDNGNTYASGEVSQRINASKGGGASLPENTQQELGHKMGADFSGVKIHTDSTAVQLSKDVGAKAFTHGNHVYFNQGQYNPNSSAGKHLLAHELTHTIQQGAAKNTIQRKPKVPDLSTTVETDVEKALTAGDKPKAMQLILNALVAKDPKKFDVNLLSKKQLYWQYGSTSNTEVGPIFQGWLAGELAKGSADLKTDKVKVRAYMKGLTVPAGKLDIKVTIAEESFKHIQTLYRTIRHEWVHVEQIKANPFEYMSSSEFPGAYANPSENDVLMAREVEAYLWAAEHMDQTGTKALPLAVWNTWNNLKDHWGMVSVKRGKPFEARYKAAFKKTWEVAFEGYLKEAEAIIIAAGTGGISTSDLNKIKDKMLYLDGMWGYRNNYSINHSQFNTRFEQVKGAVFLKKLTDIEAQLKANSIKTGIDGYNIWSPLHHEWINLSTSLQKTHDAKYSTVMPALFDKVFTLYEAQFADAFKRKDDSYVDSYIHRMGTILLNASTSKVSGTKKADYKKRLDAIKAQRKTM